MRPSPATVSAPVLPVVPAATAPAVSSTPTFADFYGADVWESTARDAVGMLFEAVSPAATVPIEGYLEDRLEGLLAVLVTQSEARKRSLQNQMTEDAYQGRDARASQRRLEDFSAQSNRSQESLREALRSLRDANMAALRA